MDEAIEVVEADVTQDQPALEAVVKFATAARYLGRVMGNLPDASVPSAIAVLRKLEKQITENNDRLKERALLWLNVHGQQVTEKGTVEGRLGDCTVRAVPNRTGIDPKKLEATLRAKKLAPADWMASTISYKLDQTKLTKLLLEGRLSQADLDACQYDKSFRIEVQGGSDE